MSKTKMEKTPKSLSEFESTLDAVIAGCVADPIDLLGIGDQEGESKYLINARRSYRRTVEDVVRLFPQRQPSSGEQVKILEIGAYLGVVSLTLSRLGFSVTACDIPEFMQNEKLRERYRLSGIDVVSANLQELEKFSQLEKFDMVIMCETLEHLNFNPIPVFLMINQVLKDCGIFYLSLPNLASLVNRAKLLLGMSVHNPIEDFFAQFRKDSNMLVGLHWREYVGCELKEIIDRTGFHVDRHYYFTSHQPSMVARVLYRLIPSIRPNQTLVATKTQAPELDLQVVLSQMKAVKALGGETCNEQ